MLSRSLFMKSLPKGKFPQGSKLREAKAELMAERVHKLFIYISTTVMLFFVLKQSNFLHRLLQGDQENPLYFDNYPCQKLPHYLDDIYVVKLTFHSYELLYTILFQSERRDFPEYIFHHILTLVLILFSYSINFLPIGAVIMFVHDLPDIFVSIFKLTQDLIPMQIQFIINSSVILSWIYFRLYVFPMHLIKVYYE